MSPRAAAEDASVDRAATLEVLVHLIVLFFVLGPILVILFPSLLIGVAAYIVAYASAPTSGVTLWLGTAYEVGPVFIIIATIAAGLIAVRCWSRSHPLADVRPIDLKGASAEPLRTAVADIWSGMGRQTTPPAVQWYPYTDIAAYAVTARHRSLLIVSAGLWRAVVDRKPIGKAILAHEIAHLIYRDPLTLRCLATLVSVTRAMLVATGIIGALATACALCNEIGTRISMRASILDIAAVVGQVLVVAATVLIFVPLGWLAVRRQVGFVTSLIEVRADITAAVWTSGLERFTQAFVDDKQVTRSTGQDVFRSLLSPTVTHVPQSARLELLKTPRYLITPKFSYYLLSLILVFTLPINFATPLFYLGIGNYVAMLLLAAAFQFSVVGMLIVGHTREVTLPWSRLVGLGVACCTVMALPRVNLEPISYLIVSWIAGFGGQPADLASLWPDIVTTANDIIAKTHDGLVNSYALAAVPLAILSLALLAETTRVSTGQSRTRRLIAPGIGTILASFAVGADAFRSPEFQQSWSVGGWLGIQGLGLTSFLAAPIAVAAFIDVVQIFLWSRKPQITSR